MLERKLRKHGKSEVFFSLCLIRFNNSNFDQTSFINRYASKIEASNNLNKLRSLVLGIQSGISTVVTFGFLGLGFW